MEKLSKHIRRWNLWRKNNLNHPFYQFLVLIGFTKSPTMPFVLLPEENSEIAEAVRKGAGIE